MSFDTHEAQHFFTLMWYLFLTHTVLFSFLFFIVIILFNDEPPLQREFEYAIAFVSQLRLQRYGDKKIKSPYIGAIIGPI